MTTKIAELGKVSPKLEVLEMGRVDYAQALGIQRGLVDERAKGSRGDVLLLLEHPHVITRGRGFNGRTMNKARASKHPVFDIDRGGDVTYHGPGQIVGYPIIHLKDRGILIGHYLRKLEDILIDTVGSFGVQASRLKGFTGIWAEGKKLASIGVAVRSWVTYHGFGLNVATDLAEFQNIYPCGLEPSQMTSLEALLGKAPKPDDVRRELAAAFRRALEMTFVPELKGISLSRASQENAGMTASGVIL